MITSVLAGCLVAAGVLAWWVPAPLSRLVATTPVVPGWVTRVRAWLRERLARKRKAGAAAELPEALELLACCLEAGAPTVRAVELVAEASPPETARTLGRVAAALHIGVDPAASWMTLAEHPDWGLPARDAARAARSGTGLATCFKVQAEESRRRLREQENKRARGIGVKSVQPLVVCFLPAFIALGVVPLVASLVARLLGPG